MTRLGSDAIIVPTEMLTMGSRLHDAIEKEYFDEKQWLYI
jgi:hypothetical protein